MAIINLNSLKNSIKNKEIGNFYIFHGIEDYIKNDYLKKIENIIVDDSLKSFNLEKFDELNFNIDDFHNAIESFPAFAQRKLVILRDIDIFKLKSDEKEQMQDILSDLPEYICLIFDYATKEFKPDKRVKIFKTIDKNADIMEFVHLSQKDINIWLKKQLNQLEISDKTCEYLCFICGMGLSNLLSECEKLTAFCHEKVEEQDINQICNKNLEAKIFDITDMILAKDISGAKNMVHELILQKNDEFSILSVINSQFQRLYTAKLGQYKDEQYFMNLWGIYSAYAVKITRKSCQNVKIGFLRESLSLCMKASVDFVSQNIEKYQLLENLIVKIGALYDKY